MSVPCKYEQNLMKWMENPSDFREKISGYGIASIAFACILNRREFSFKTWFIHGPSNHSAHILNYFWWYMYQWTHTNTRILFTIRPFLKLRQNEQQQHQQKNWAKKNIEGWPRRKKKARAKHLYVRNSLTHFVRMLLLWFFFFLVYWLHLNGVHTLWYTY